MDTKEAKIIKSVEETIPGFETAGARLVVKASSLDENKACTADVDKQIDDMVENLKTRINMDGGIPFKFSKVIVKDGCKYEGNVVLDDDSPWGVLLNDLVVGKLLKAGCITLRQTTESGIQYTEKFSTTKLKELNINVNQVLYHPLFDMFYTEKGKKATVSYTRVLLSRNSSLTEYK